LDTTSIEVSLARVAGARCAAFSWLDLAAITLDTGLIDITGIVAVATMQVAELHGCISDAYSAPRVAGVCIREVSAICTVFADPIHADTVATGAATCPAVLWVTLKVDALPTAER